MNDPNGKLVLKIIKRLDTYSILLMTLVLVFFFLTKNHSFLSIGNIFNLIQQNASLVIVAVGMTFVIISGNIDLSSGSIIVFSSCMAGIVFLSTDNIWLALLACVGIASVIGIFNGFLIARVGINPVITTLACMIWARGLALAATNASSIPISSAVLQAMYTPFAFKCINIILFIIIIIFYLGWFLLNKTKFGRYTFAIGGSEVSAIQAGIKAGNIKWAIFFFAAFLTGIAGIIDLARLGSAVSTLGVNMEMDAIVAVVIGGNLLSGGEGSFLKTFTGLLFICILSSGLSTFGVTDDIYYLIRGSIILGVLAAQVICNNYRVKYLRMVNDYK
jgi:ribose transport system permease protein